MEVDRLVFYCKSELSFLNKKTKQILQHIYNSSVDGRTQDMLVPLLFIVVWDNKQLCTKEKLREHAKRHYCSLEIIPPPPKAILTSRSGLRSEDKVFYYQLCEREEHSPSREGGVRGLRKEVDK